jgi:hypothetical protein
MIAKSVEMNENMREEALDECYSIAESMIEEMQFIGMAGMNLHICRGCLGIKNF